MLIKHLRKQSIGIKMPGIAKIKLIEVVNLGMQMRLLAI